MSERSLFRSEALQFAGQSFLGKVTIDQPVTLRVVTGLLVALTCALLLYLVLGEYARKETVSGYLDPERGVVGVYAPGSGGIVQALHVSNGQYVSKGAPLFQVEYPRDSVAGNDSMAVSLAELQRQKQQLQAQAKHSLGSFHGERKHLLTQLSDIEQELSEQQAFGLLQTERIAVDDSLLAALDKLRAGGGISRSSWLRAQAEKLEQEKELVLARQRETRMLSRKAALHHELQQLPAERDIRALQFSVEISRINKQIAELSTQKSRIVNAPVAGLISGLQVVPGMAPSGPLPLVAIVPAAVSLQAVLLIPSSAVGFIEPGQAVRMMFDAFPHQQFGTHPGSIDSVSMAPISAADLRAPIRVGAPVFVARVALAGRHFHAMGEQRVLQPGMLLKADIVLERRSLFAWLMEPLYSLRGRS